MSRGTFLVVGATSTIGRCVARRLAAEGCGLCLTGRDPEELAAVAADIAVRYGRPPLAVPLEARDFASYPALMDACGAIPGGLAGAVITWGMPEDPLARTDPAATAQVVEVNLTAPALLLEWLADRLGSGSCLAVLSSVAGDRGRADNRLYGAAKAGLNVFLAGLRAHCDRRGIRVLTVKLGRVDTRLSFGLAGAFLAIPPEAAAKAVVRSLRRGRGTVYIPGWWRWIMLALRSLPEGLFRRLAR